MRFKLSLWVIRETIKNSINNRKKSFWLKAKNKTGVDAIAIKEESDGTLNIFKIMQVSRF